MKRFIIATLIFSVLCGISYAVLFRAVSTDNSDKTLVVELDDTYEDVIEFLVENNYVRSELGLRIALATRAKQQIEPGGYKIAKNMSTFQYAHALTSDPSLVWVVVPEGLRKEEIADLFAEKLDWENEDVEMFTQAAKMDDMVATEGVYYPDTYLVPRNEDSLYVARRMFNRFNEVFQPLTPQLLEENIKNDTALKIASLVQRETAKIEEMPLISGIIWNRLLNDMKLDIDASLQYIHGNEEDGWWTPVSPEDKETDSFYNTYKYKGLPPQPIANPGIDAIKAVISPADTNCFYYLHDSEGEIHCSRTYQGHLKNIETYLKQE